MKDNIIRITPRLTNTEPSPIAFWHLLSYLQYISNIYLFLSTVSLFSFSLSPYALLSLLQTESILDTTFISEKEISFPVSSFVHLILPSILFSVFPLLFAFLSSVATHAALFVLECMTNKSALEDEMFVFVVMCEHKQRHGSLVLCSFFLQLSKPSLYLSLVQVRAMRLSFVGELGWELHIPKDSCLPVYNAVMAAGAKHSIINSGYRAIDSLSIEKGNF